VAGRAIPNGPVVIGPAHAVATRATTLRRSRAFEHRESVGRTFYSTRLILLRKRDLLRRKVLVAKHRRPRGSRVPAVQELLVDRVVTTPAVRRRDARVNDEPVVVPALLTGGHLVAVEAVYPLPGVRAHFKLVHNRVLRVQMTLGAFAARAHKGCARLLDYDARSTRIDQVSGDDQGRGNDQRNEDVMKLHSRTSQNGLPPPVKRGSQPQVRA